MGWSSPVRQHRKTKTTDSVSGSRVLARADSLCHIN